jgi:hypothetical protein
MSWHVSERHVPRGCIRWGSGYSGNLTLGWWLCGPLGCCWLATLATSVPYASLLPVRSGCQLLWAASSPVVPWAPGPSLNSCPGAGRWLAGSDWQSELESSSAFILLTLACRGSHEFRVSPPISVGFWRAESFAALALVAASAFFFQPPLPS